MRWNLRMRAAERGIWKSTEMRRLLAEAGLEISAGKMSALWTTTPTTIRLDDLDIICSVLDCNPAELLICEPEKVAAGRPAKTAKAAGAATPINPRLGRNRSLPPA
jgi:DNA-binding Xre family transcriptional regulator